MTKEEIAQNEQFLLLPQCFPLLVIGYPLNYRDFLFFDKIRSKSSAAELSYEGKGNINESVHRKKYKLAFENRPAFTSAQSDQYIHCSHMNNKSLLEASVNMC